MDIKNHYATLGVDRRANPVVIKRAYRKLARKYHPDVSREPDAEARFKDVAEAHEALIDPDRRAAYDDLASSQHGQAEARRRPPRPAPTQDSSHPFAPRAPKAGNADPAEFNEFFESLFGRRAQGGGARHEPEAASPARSKAGADRHIRIEIDLRDAYIGARHTVSLRRPVIETGGRVKMEERRIEVGIPMGVRAGQQLRLVGLGDPGQASAASGDLYLEVAFRPEARFRVEGADVWMDLPLAPWEAALGATVTASTPAGDVALEIPAASSAGRKLRLKGKGLPGRPAGDLYAVLQIALPPPDSDIARAAYGAMATAFAGFAPRVGAKHPQAAVPA